MKNHPLPSRVRSQKGFALMLVMVFTGISLFVLGGALSWTADNTFKISRNNDYFTTAFAAEAATEKVLSAITKDFQDDGEARVYANISTYKEFRPKRSEEGFWSDFTFTAPGDGSEDASGDTGKIFVERQTSWGWTELTSQYAGLRGNASTYRVIANARMKRDNGFPTRAGIRQDFQIASIPVFQFAIFYGLNMEISCGQPFAVTGRVHSNKELYVCPDNSLTFQTHVTAVGNITFGRAPGDGRGPPSGTVTYMGDRDAKVGALTLPIGTNNTPDAVRAIVEIPPPGESASSPMGRQRYYNKADMVIVVSNTSVTAVSGSFNGFSTAIPSGQIAGLVTTNSSFWDGRESKWVRPLTLDVGKLKDWSTTNTSIRPALGNRDVRLVYVADYRTVDTNTDLVAVRLTNGAALPATGLTVATERPLYVQGHYNAPVADRGTSNTLSTLPASLVSDAITVLSAGWTDPNSTLAVGSRTASHTTINAAFLSGIVETPTHNIYSGGAENFPRFLETWGSSRTFTYNGSMVVMFASKYARGRWGLSSVYSPPKRNWTFDLNFMDSVKLPPGTPELRTIIRGTWSIIAPDTTVPAS